MGINKKKRKNMKKINAVVDIVKVTPEMASEWLLDKWPQQRKIRHGHVQRLASDMMAGRFMLGPDAILRICGKLANGQHRLEAVVSCGKSQDFIVMDSKDQELYKILDAGMKRLVSDSLIGVQYAGDISSAARWVKAYDDKTITPSCGTDMNKKSVTVKGLTIAVRPTQTEMIEYCMTNMESLAEGIKFVKPLYDKVPLLQVSVAGAIHVIGSRKNKHKTEEFLEALYSGNSNSVASDLHNRLIMNKRSASRLKTSYIFSLTLKALKYYLQGTRPGTLKYVVGEQLPVI